MNIQPIEDRGLPIVASDIGQDLLNYFHRTKSFESEKLALVTYNDGTHAVMELSIAPIPNQAKNEESSQEVEE